MGKSSLTPVHDDFMRVKQEYQAIEDAMDKQRPQNQLKTDRYVSQRQRAEQEKKYPDPLKLNKG